jgi:hypothetical protein
MGVKPPHVGELIAGSDEVRDSFPLGSINKKCLTLLGGAFLIYGGTMEWPSVITH